MPSIVGAKADLYVHPQQSSAGIQDILRIFLGQRGQLALERLQSPFLFRWQIRAVLAEIRRRFLEKPPVLTARSRWLYS